MKRYCIVALALILALSLFACGGKPEPEAAAEPAAQTEAASEPNEEPETETEPEAPAGPVETEAPVPKDLEPADIAGVWKFGSEGNKLFARLTFTDGVDLLHYYAKANGTKFEGTVPFAIADGSGIGFSCEGSDAIAQYDPETDTIKCPGVFFNAPMTFRRVPEEELSEEEKPIVLTEEASQFVGTWQLVSLGTSGNVIAAEDIGQDIALVLYGDGSAEMITGSSREYYRWTFADGAVTLYGNTVVYAAAFENGQLKLLEPQNGVVFFFEKKN